jgi:hypothetical protein
MKNTDRPAEDSVTESSGNFADHGINDAAAYLARDTYSSGWDG